MLPTAGMHIISNNYLCFGLLRVTNEIWVNGNKKVIFALIFMTKQNWIHQNRPIQKIIRLSDHANACQGWGHKDL